MFRERAVHLILLLFPFFAAAQVPLEEQKYVDSLSVLVNNVKLPDSVKANASLIIAGRLGDYDQNKAYRYLKNGRQLARHSKFLIAASYFYEGCIQSQRDFAKSEKLYEKSDSLMQDFRTREAYIFRSKLWLNYASIQQYKDNQTGMMSIIVEKCIPLAKKAGDTLLLSYHYADLATTLSNNSEDKKAAAYYKLAIQQLTKIPKKSTRIASVYVGAAYTFCSLGNFKQAELALNHARKMLANFPNSTAYPDFYCIESTYLRQTGHILRSLESAEKGLVLAREMSLSYMLPGLLIEKFEGLKDLKRYEEAKQVYTLLNKDAIFNSLASDKMHIYNAMSEIYAAQDSMQLAYNWMQKYSLLSDSLNDSKRKNEINALEIKFRNAENQNKIILLKTEKAKAESEMQNNRLLTFLLITAVIVFLLVLVLIILYYRNNKKLAIEQTRNYRYKLVELDQQKQLQVSSALIEGEERERIRIARDLHDGLGGMLAGVKLNFLGAVKAQAKQLALSGSDFPVSSAYDNKVLMQLDNSLTELRRIAKNMMPETLTKFGLEKAIRDLCDSLATEQLQIEFQAFGISSSISDKTQIVIYRIIQEILANAIRHASAASIILQCSQNESTFFITAEDDGCGFDSAVVKYGMGLQNIRNRVDYLKGRLELTSKVNEGTTINIELHV